MNLNGDATPWLNYESLLSLVDSVTQQVHEQTPSERYDEFKAEYWSRPAAFVSDCITLPKGRTPAPYQLEALDELFTHKRLAVRGPHGLGKTALAAWAILWFALTRDGQDWKIPTTASVWRQLQKFLWPEVHKWSRHLRWPKIGREPFGRSELLKLTLRLATGEASAIASNNHELIEGAHADHLLYIFDEAKAISDDTFDAAEGAFSGAGPDTQMEALALAISTPGAPAGRFHDTHKRKPGLEDWTTQHVTLEEAIAAGRISRHWANQRKKQWGENSAVYQNRVLGEFAAGDEDAVIPLAWLEHANEVWHQWQEEQALAQQEPAIQIVAADIARSGADSTIIAPRSGNVIAELRKYDKQSTMATTGRIIGLLRKYPDAIAIIDVIGIGAGVVDRAREYKDIAGRIVAYNGAEAAAYKRGRTKVELTDESGELTFANKRSWAYWNLREMLDPESDHQVGLPPDDELTGDLTTPTHEVRSGGRIHIEKKVDVKKRVGRSPDAGDTVVMAFANLPDLAHDVEDAYIEGTDPIAHIGQEAFA